MLSVGDAGSNWQHSHRKSACGSSLPNSGDSAANCSDVCALSVGDAGSNWQHSHRNSACGTPLIASACQQPLHVDCWIAQICWRWFEAFGDDHFGEADVFGDRVAGAYCAGGYEAVVFCDVEENERGG